MANQRPMLWIVDFFKTMNQKTKKSLLPKDTGYYAGNLRFDNEYGSIEKRLSRAKYNSTSIGSFPVTSLFRYYKNSNNSAALLGTWSGFIKIGYDATGIFSTIVSGMTSDIWSFLTYKDFTYIVNGYDANKVFTFTTPLTKIETMGVPSLATIPSATISLTAGNLSGTYYYAFSQQLDGYQEGNVSPSTSGLLATGSYNKVVLPSSGNTRCTGFYLYRSRGTASPLYYLAAFTGNSGTITYADNVADSSLDTSRIAPIDYGVPNYYKFICLHKERVFMAWTVNNRSKSIFSDIRSGMSYPDVFPVNNYYFIGRDDGDEITGMANDQFGKLIFFKKNSVRILNTSADAPLTWALSDSYSNLGNVAPYSLANTPVGLVYLTRMGEQKNRIVRWTGSSVEVIAQLEGVEPILTSIPETAMEDVRGHYHNGYYYLSYRTDGEYNDKVMMVDIYNWTVEIDNKNVACFASFNGGNDFGELYTGTSDQSGFVYREDADAFDLAVKYKSELDTGSFSDTATSGGETTPSLGLVANPSSTFAGRTWANMTGTNTTWAEGTARTETWWYTGEWYDSVREISSRALNALLWNSSGVADTTVSFYIRTGDTSALCLAASWNGPYTNSGDSLAAVTAAKYVQVRAVFAVKNRSDYDKCFIYRNGTSDSDYVFQISANYGTPAESTIEMDWQSGRIDLGDVNEVYKRLRKRVRSVKIEYEKTGSAGNFQFVWYANGSTTQTGSFTTTFVDYPRERTYDFPANTIYNDFSYRLYSNSDTDRLTFRRVIFTISTEPYFVKA